MTRRTYSFWLLAMALTANEAAARAEPAAKATVEPGIAGLKMVDARDHRHMWAEIGKLQIAESGRRMTPDELRVQAIERTTQYLGLEGEAAKRFSDESLAKLHSVRDAFLAYATVGPQSAEQAAYEAQLKQVVAQMSSLVGDSPRAKLLEPELTKWVMKLSLGANDVAIDRSQGRRWTPQPASTANRKVPATAP